MQERDARGGLGMTEYKQVIAVRSDLKMSKGKLAAQASHASVEAVLRSDKDDIKFWREQGMKKIVVKVATKEALFTLKQEAEDAGLVCALITDAGHTEVEPGTVTCLGIGPDKEEKMDKVTGKLAVL